MVARRRQAKRGGGSGAEVGDVDEEVGRAVVGAAAKALAGAARAGERGDQIETDAATRERDGEGVAGAWIEAVVDAEGDVEGGVAGVRVDREGVEAADLQEARGARAGGGR